MFEKTLFACILRSILSAGLFFVTSMISIELLVDGSIAQAQNKPYIAAFFFGGLSFLCIFLSCGLLVSEGKNILNLLHDRDEEPSKNQQTH